MNDFVSRDGLTWQGQGPTHSPMESTPSLPDRSPRDHIFSEGDPGTSTNQRLPYFQPQVQRRHGRATQIDHLSENEVLDLLREALEWSNLSCPATWPLPPTGLPGRLHDEYDRYEDAAAVIRIGLDYVKAAIRSQPRAMHNCWHRARQLLADVESGVADRVRSEAVAEKDRIEYEFERRVVGKQLVYFIGADAGPVKIGISVNPYSRLATLQTSHHDRLTLLATCEGGAEQERAYHEQFAEHRLNGEWFSRAPEILAEIERIGAPSSIRVVERDL